MITLAVACSHLVLSPHYQRETPAYINGRLFISIRLLVPWSYTWRLPSFAAKFWRSSTPDHDRITLPSCMNRFWKYCGIHPGCRQSLAVDLCCGSGISTKPLAQHFDRVIGIDLSQAQIDNAKTDLPNIQFRVGPGEDLPFLTNESVDLITIATGLHWLNKDHAFAEIKRVLRSRGVFAACAYGSVRVDCALADHHLQDVSWKIPPSPYHMSHCLPWNSKSLLKLSNSCRNFCTLGFPFCLLVAPPEEIASSSKLM